MDSSERDPAHAELVILGCGPAGYSAAVHAARANLRPMLISGLAESTASAPSADIGAWPVDVDVVHGPELKQRLRDHAERPSTRVVFDRIVAVDLAKRPFWLQGGRGNYTCDALIVAVDGPHDMRLFSGQLEMANGHIATQTGLSGMATMTSLRGVFVAGGPQQSDLDRLITRTGSGCMAALDAQRFLGL